MRPVTAPGILLALLLLPAVLLSQHYTIDPAAKRKIDSTYNSYIKKYKIVGASIAIVDKGEIVYATGYGYSDRLKKTPVTDRTIFRIGSCTKSFTALSIMQLHERGLLDINHSMMKYLPELKISSRFNDSNSIVIRDVLSHVSGLPCDVTNGFFCDSPPDMRWLIGELNKQSTISPRRFQHAYSNVGYGLLGEVIARKSGMSYSNYIREHVFLPLGMTSSYVENDTALCAGFSKAYCSEKEITEPQIRDQAAGLIHSNAADMARYLQMYLNEGKFKEVRVLSAELITEMRRDQAADIKLPSSEQWGYGLYSKKIQMKEKSDSAVVTLVEHAGDTYAFHADFGFIPELNMGVVVLTNTDHGSRIASAGNLLKLYARESAGKTLRLTYKAPGDTLQKKKDIVCSAEEARGQYNMGSLLMDVKKMSKISFKQGIARIVLRPKATDPRTYTARAILFGIIPVKVPNQEFRFVKFEGATFFKAYNSKYKEESYVAIKSAPRKIPEKWKARYGNYRITGANYPCTGCPYMNTEGMTMRLKEKDGFVMLQTKAKSSDMNNQVFLEVIDDDNCVTGGIGRGTGEVVRVLDNGNLYYSGFEFARAK